jgi:hypothetical protein
MDWAHIPELVGAAQSAALDMINLCIWTKPNAGMGGLYRSQHELVFVFKLGSGRHRNNVQLGSMPADEAERVRARLRRSYVAALVNGVLQARTMEIGVPHDPANGPGNEFEISFPVRRSGRC